MSDQNTTETSNSQVAGEAVAQAVASTPDSQESIKNLKGEFNRRISKLNDKLDTLINRVSPVTQQADEAVKVEPDVKQYIDTALTHEKQVSAWQVALETFPELNPDSESFDENFYKAVDAEFSTNMRKDPKGPLKAARLMALELGKIEQLTRQSLLKDEARRSRIISEGSSTPRESKKDKDPSQGFNVKGLAKLGIDPTKLAKRIKDNKEKYEG